MCNVLTIFCVCVFDDFSGGAVDFLGVEEFYCDDQFMCLCILCVCVFDDFSHGAFYFLCFEEMC